MSRHVLPGQLPHSFRVAHARSLGVGEGRLRGNDLERVFHGARTRAGIDEDSGGDLPWAVHERADLLRRMRAYLPVMPGDAFFVGVTAAVVWGIPLPAGVHSELRVGVRHPRTAPRRPGIRGVQVMPRMVDVVSHGGFRVTRPASTWAMLGGELGRYDLVAATDALLRVPRHPGGFRPPSGPAFATRDELTAALTAGRRRGARALAEALERARTGASSRPESWLRLILIDGGLPEPDLDGDVFSDDGEFLGCSELIYRRERLAVEYESDGHLTRRQLERDIEKYEAYAAAGWRTVRVTSRNVFAHPSTSVQRVAAALAERRGGALPPTL